MSDPRRENELFNLVHFDSWSTAELQSYDKFFPSLISDPKVAKHMRVQSQKDVYQRSSEQKKNNKLNVPAFIRSYIMKTSPLLLHPHPQRLLL